MHTIAFATWRDQAAITGDDGRLVDALARLGCRVQGWPWDAPVDWSRYDAVLPRSTWDFHRRLPEFRAWLDRVDRAGTPMLNPVGVLRWNLTKRYLVALADRGVRVVPTLWFAGGAREPAALEPAVRAQGWSDGIVVKPIVSASGHGTWSARRADSAQVQARFDGDLADSAEGLMVQPFLPQVRQQGEWSLVFFAGRFSHAVIKRPAAGEFRVQAEHGGAAVPARPAPSLVRDASRALHAAAACTGTAPEALVYARVDGVQADRGLVLMELELVEPALHLDADPCAAGRMAAAIRHALAG